MSSNFPIELNFLPIKGEFPLFHVYTTARDAESERPIDDAIGTSVPDGDDRLPCWASFVEQDGWTQREVGPEDNLPLCVNAMFFALKSSAESRLEDEQFFARTRGFYKELSFPMREHPEGFECLKIQPYLLKAKGLFGWLTDFHFKKNQGIGFSRRVQQLSLSLDRNFKKNLNCYLDRVNKINEFLVQRRDVIESAVVSGTKHPLCLGSDRVQLRSRKLKTKIYLFGGEKENRGQYVGLKRNGPLKESNECPHLVFAFRERDRIHARKLALALKGTLGNGKFAFPGFSELFRSEFSISANPIVLTDYTRQSMENALNEFNIEKAKAPSAIPIFVLPKADDNGYLYVKSIFAKDGIATQVCTTSLIQDDYGLKWAIANIALQVFCKAGGQPWRVKPTDKKALILGISQSYKKTTDAEREAKVDRYFSFSVLTDNSGLFQEIKVLADSADKSSYVQQLNNNLSSVLQEKADEYDRVAIHTSFRLKKIEMDAIRDTVTSALEKDADKAGRFAIIKINHKTRFFGTNPEVNSLVPYEGATVRLGGGEHLIWFEGIYPDTKTVTKPFAGPTHVQFLRFDGAADDEEAMLQDLVNLSGANWRGFNAKAAPVSVFYCHLVADLVRNMHSMDLPIPNVENIQPWFL